MTEQNYWRPLACKKERKMKELGSLNPHGGALPNGLKTSHKASPSKGFIISQYRHSGDQAFDAWAFGGHLRSKLLLWYSLVIKLLLADLGSLSSLTVFWRGPVHWSLPEGPARLHQEEVSLWQEHASAAPAGTDQGAGGTISISEPQQWCQGQIKATPDTAHTPLLYVTHSEPKSVFSSSFRGSSQNELLCTPSYCRKWLLFQRLGNWLRTKAERTLIMWQLWERILHILYSFPPT
jgi:hypothetical protein